MEKKELAAFHVRVLSTENATWQGVVEAEGEAYSFHSEIQLFKWLLQKYPDLIPDAGFKTY